MSDEAQVAYKSSTITKESCSRDYDSRRVEIKPVGSADREAYASSPECYTMPDANFSSSASELKPQIQSRGSRIHYYGRKLAFWRKKPKTALDVHSALSSVAKSHERYLKTTVHAAKVMKEWSDYLRPPPLGRAQDLMQHMMIDEKLSRWIASALDATAPLNELDLRLSDIHLAMVQSFETIKREEASIKLLLHKQNSAERRYFKALADDLSEKDTKLLNHERIRLSGDVELATEQFRATCRRELPLRLTQFTSHYEKLALEASQSARSLDELTNGANVMMRTHSIRDRFSFCSPSSVGFVPSSPVSISPLQLHKYPSASMNSTEPPPTTSPQSYDEPLTPESAIINPSTPAESIEDITRPLDPDEFVWG